MRRTYYVVDFKGAQVTAKADIAQEWARLISRYEHRTVTVTKVESGKGLQVDNRFIGSVCTDRLINA